MYWVCICFRALTLHTIDNAKNEEKMSNYNDVTQLTAYGTNSQKPKKNQQSTATKVSKPHIINFSLDFYFHPIL